MASQWYYKAVVGQVGPVSSAELRALAQRGAILPSTLVATEPNGDWVRAERVQGLFPDSRVEPPQLPAPPPPVGKRIVLKGKPLHCSRTSDVKDSEDVPPPVPRFAAEVVGSQSMGDDGGVRGKSPFDCPACGSDQTQKVSVIYESGTAYSQSSSLASGVAYAAGRFVPAIGGGSTTSRQQSSLAVRLAPPKSPELIPIVLHCDRLTAMACYCIAGAILVSAIVGLSIPNDGVPRPPDSELSSILWGVVIFMASIPFAAGLIGSSNLPLAEQQRLENKAILGAHRERLEAWRRSYFCHRCGNVFTPETTRKAVIRTQCDVPQNPEGGGFSFTAASGSLQAAKQAQGNGLIAAGYLCAVAALLFLPPVLALVAFIIGIINLTRNQIGHGIAQIVLSFICGFLGMAIGASLMS